MNRFSLEHLADDSLLDGLHSLVEHDRTTTAELLAHIGEVARRRLYAERGCRSMQEYCVRELHLSEDAASKRVQVARKGWLFPVIFEAIADGRVHLTGMNLLVPFMDEENVHELIAAAIHRTKAEIEVMLAEQFPRAESREAVLQEDVNAPAHLRSVSSLKPIAPDRWLVQFTITDADRERMEYARQLMSHRDPHGSLAHLHRVALDLLIDELEKEKIGETDAPRGIEASSSGRYIPRSVRREVWKRDGGACTWVSSTGRRCGSRWLVEFDHVDPFARGGEATADNVRLLCRTHNQLEAERAFGSGFMEQKRREARDQPAA